jgi:hypothetical protein
VGAAKIRTDVKHREAHQNTPFIVYKAVMSHGWTMWRGAYGPKGACEERRESCV